VTADLAAAGDPWQRLAHLYQEVATVVADATRRGAGPAVFSGDCTTSLGTVAGSACARYPKTGSCRPTPATSTRPRSPTWSPQPSAATR
jgi:hypothetical protein